MTRPWAVAVIILAIAGWGLVFSLAIHNIDLRCMISDLREMVDIKTDLAATMADAAIYAEDRARFVTLASWYGGQHNGRATASGAIFDEREFTAASPWLPFGSRWIVRRIDTGAEVCVTITDRGPHMRLGRGLDLSTAAARELGMLEVGLARVELRPGN
jgi:rare lipoprotein A